MPKQKTHKSASKRIIKLTTGGQYMARTMSAQHRTSGKATRVLQRSRNTNTLPRTENKRLAKLLPGW
ncbi:50S ribosomal protein L35 [Candidatus Berkelbacteria bacterium]|nr:50S ribosomal protein L35 [Candidatus Berkelbacteria bacterium]